MKPERILKVDKSVLIGAKYMFPFKPRIVSTKKKPQKLTRVSILSSFLVLTMNYTIYYPAFVVIELFYFYRIIIGGTKVTAR